MAEYRLLRALLDERAAVTRVGALLDAADVQIERRVYYPYYHFAVQGELRWLFRRKRLRFDCLVDARTGHASSADPLDVERVATLSEGGLAVQQTPGEAARRARRYAQHAMGRGLRLMSNFNTRLEACGVVYRPFWILGSGSMRILLDAVTGELHPLSNPATTPQSDPSRGPLSGTLNSTSRAPRRTEHEQIFTT